MKSLKRWINFYKNQNTSSEFNRRVSALRAADFGKSIALLTIQLYQVTLGRFIGGGCRFYPSCSHYAIEAYRTHSFLKATEFTLKRIANCHPLGSAGYDPVPVKGKNNEA